MAFSEIELKKIEILVGGLCRKHTHALEKDLLRIDYNILDDEVLILECRPLERDPDEWLKFPVARIQFNPETEEWQLFSQQPDGVWVTCIHCPATTDLLQVVTMIDINRKQAFFREPVKLV